ncbi:Fanconi anemia group M protein [Habropoda laboriosa]|uniref:Fanconi anemia group M protein n=1 Tax=Habropoda laboriosa TaxID=597456 RepID=A0A0L7RB12_9HYME|nr:Fanconi anemia group M protein [Habropoda laboriosa]
MELSQCSQISSDIKTKGFDISAGKTWIYPINYPVRDYQFNIVQACLYNNTLVCLPTGLGKTFIAAVIMYNFWRWYPRGKVVFLAPTKPLVAQQIFACHNIMGIPSAETIELTGAVNKKQREISWSRKRVIFATPQVFHNDLDKNIVPSELVKCVVIDEAHKALGKHSYCECIRILIEKNQTFRVLALSATPGNKIDNVHEILQNLLIAHVELRDETSLDIVPYINQRKIDIILVPLNKELAEYKQRYIFIMDHHVKILLQHNVLRAETANISKGRVFHLLREFKKKTDKSGNYGQIIKTLNILMTMYHAYELMVRDGLRAFYKFYQNHSDKFWMNGEPQLQTLLEDIKTYLGPFPDVKSLCEDAVIDIPQNLVYGHAKFEKLKELLLHHFAKSDEKESDTRAIVFVEYRDIVSEIYILLLQCRPSIRPQMFVGQAGQKQKQQIKALENFRNNHVNVLISTSIGEEGLDVGEVDLIICFDIFDGHIIILVTDGKEHETLKSTMARRDSLNHKILNTSNIVSSLYQTNPRMIPDTCTPECLKMHISLLPKTPVTKSKNGKGKSDKKGNSRKNMLKGVTTIESNSESQKDGTKFSMVKYLKGEQYKDRDKNNFDALSSNETQSSNVCNIIKPSDVKILFYDNDAVDFLTTCTLKNSEIPDIKILDCLTILNDIIPLDREKKSLNNGNKSDVDDENDLYGNECVLENRVTEFDNKCIGGEIKFEDLLDDSSKSNESDLLCREGKKLEERYSESGYRSEAVGSKAIGTENENNSLENWNFTKFEDILYESSDESGANVNVEKFEPIEKKDIDTHNDVQVKKLRNIKEWDDSISEAESKSAHFEGTIDKRSEKLDRYKCNSECKDQSILSITQAIDEIARLNSNLTVSKVMNESEDDMFQDENLVQIDNELNVSREIDNSIVENLGRNLSEFKVEEYEWDDDFKISNVDPIRVCTQFDRGEKRDDKLVEASKMETRCSDSDEWISVKKSFDISKGGNVSSHTSISKKLASISRSRNSRYENAKECFRDEYDSVKDDPSLTEKEGKCSYFCDVRQEDCHVKLHGTSFQRKKKNGERKTEHLQIHNPYRKFKRTRNRKNKFIDDEAEVSSYNDTTDESSETDEDLKDFVSYTQNVHDTSDIHAHYLQSTRSPMKRQDGFIFKQPRVLDSSIEIYSQPISQAHESYINDSFCIDEEVQETTRVEELSILEQAEQELERRKRKRTCDERLGRNVKRRNKQRNIIKGCSSSEDETEMLRKEVMDESLLLARSRS